MPILSFDNLAVLFAVAFSVPFLIGLAPQLRLPAIAFEILAGFAIGQHGFKCVKVDTPVQVFSTVGLSALLFLAGFEFDVRRLQGPRFSSIAWGFGLSLVLAVILAFALNSFHFSETTFLLATIFASSSLGLIVPLLKDAKEDSTALGELVIAGAALGEIGPLVMLSLVFSASAEKAAVQIGLLIGLAIVVGLVGFAVSGAKRVGWLTAPIERMHDTSAQLRVRGVVMLLGGVGVFAYHLGFEAILGAFLAGALLSQIAGDGLKENPIFTQKLEAIGFGVFIPIFFITSGMNLDLVGLVHDPSAVAKVPLYLAALLIARGIPALLYREHVGLRGAFAGGLFQATSLSFIVAASSIGLTTGLLDANTAAALVGAGLLSALIFPVAGLITIAGRGIEHVEAEIGEAIA